MKQGTVKMPIQPKIDHNQGQNLFAKLFDKLLSSYGPMLGEWKPTKHEDGKRCQNSTNFIRKIKAKKKRKRKIAYASKMANRFPSRRKVRT